MAVPGSLRIRRARPADLARLEKSLGQRYFFAERLERQRDGHGVLLLAWLDDEPIGDVYLWLAPAEEREIRERLPGVALLNHLEVRADLRNRGIGTAVIEHAEDLLRWRRIPLVALGVDPGNAGAIRLYRRLGYTRWSHPDIATSSELFLDSGERLRVPEICRVFVKDLSPT